MDDRIDTFARDHLPAAKDLPEFVFDRPELQFAPRLNCAGELLDAWVARGEGGRRCLVGADGSAWTYAELQAQANRIARVLVEDLGLIRGNRVLLRGANSPMLAACFLAIFKAGGIAVGSMPLLRAKELTQIVTKAQITHALCDARLTDELQLARPACPTLTQLLHFNGDAADRLEARAAAKPAPAPTPAPAPVAAAPAPAPKPVEAPKPAPTPAPTPQPAPVAAAPQPEKKKGFFARLFGL